MMNNIYRFAILIGVALIASACSTTKEYKLKPYPSNMSFERKVMLDNKEYWQIDLSDDIEDFNQFVDKTFKNLKNYKNRYEMRYKGHKGKHHYDAHRQSTQKETNQDIDEIIYGQYN